MLCVSRTAAVELSVNRMAAEGTPEPDGSTTRPVSTDVSFCAKSVADEKTIGSRSQREHDLIK
jgi:hypothetical protein